MGAAGGCEENESRTTTTDRELLEGTGETERKDASHYASHAQTKSYARLVPRLA